MYGYRVARESQKIVLFASPSFSRLRSVSPRPNLMCTVSPHLALESPIVRFYNAKRIGKKRFDLLPKITHDQMRAYYRSDRKIFLFVPSELLFD